MRKRPRILSLIAGLIAAGAVAALAEPPGWVSRGPDDVGSIIDIKAADGVVYAATLGGIYRSTSDGQGWELSGMRNEVVFAIAARSGSPVFAIVGNGGLVVSRNAGGSWDRLAPSDARLTAVAIDPREPSTAYLAGREGVVWKSTDAGASWKRVSSTTLSYVGAITFDPHDNALVLLGFANFSSASTIRRSTDGGTSFSTVSITGHSNTQWTAISAGPEGSHRFYAVAPGLVCQTADGAATWACASISTNVWRIVDIPSESASATPVLLAASDLGLIVSRDGGATWSPVGAPLTTPNPGVEFDEASGAAFAGTSTSIYRSNDRGATWSWQGHGLRSTWISDLAVDPADSRKLFAVNSVSSEPAFSLFQSGDEGRHWSSLESASAPSGLSSVLVDRSSSSVLYGLANGAFFRSADAGTTWSAVRSNSSYLSLLASDPRSPATIWSSDSQGLAHSENRGDTWQRSGLSQQVYSLVFDSHDPATLYAGSYYDISSGFYGYPGGGSIFVSRDLGATWTRGPEDLGAAPVALAADPFAAGVVYAGTAGVGVLSSVDGGHSWLRSPADGAPVTVTALVADPLRPGYLYAAADGTIYRSRDGGSGWELFADGFDAPPVSDLAIAAGGRRLVAATTGAGIFEIDLSSVAPSFPCVAAPGQLCLLGGRYMLEVKARSHALWSPGTARALTDRAGYFGFAAVTGDPTFPEIVVKMLPDGALGPGGPAIFHASLTTLPYLLTLTDTVTGQQRFYTGNENAALCGGVDRPFRRAVAAIYRPESAAAPADAALFLLGHRFSIAVHARDPRTGREADGLGVASGDRWGYFSLPDVTGDPALPEVIVKMVDARTISGKFWFFHTGLTSLDYTLTVTDSENGAVRTYQSPGAFCGSADTAAFPD